MRWYAKIEANPDQFFENVADAVEYYWTEYEDARKEIRPERGMRIEELSLRIPGIMEYRYSQHQELEMILRKIELQYEVLRGEKKKGFLEHYNRNLTDRQADQYANIEPDVVLLREFMNQVELIRNKFQAITKGIESLHFQIGNIIQLRKAGIEDATL